MKNTVLVNRPIPDSVTEYLREQCNLLEWHGEQHTKDESFYELLAQADGLLTSGTAIDAALLNLGPKLQVVSNISVGYNNFDLAEMRSRGILGTHTPGVLDDTVADLILGLMLSAARRMPELDQLVRTGGWKKGTDDYLFGVDVHHANLGIIGMGRIGEAVAQRAHFGFGMNIVYSNRRRSAEAESRFGAVYLPMNELLEKADFVVVMTPLSKETEKLIGREQFASMKRSAIFINASRGQVVDEAALIEALQTGQIRGAGLDVFQLEPISPDNPLLKLPNTALMPHIGSATNATRTAMAMLAARSLVSTLAGKPMNVVKELQATNEPNSQIVK